MRTRRMPRPGWNDDEDAPGTGPTHADIDQRISESSKELNEIIGMSGSLSRVSSGGVRVATGAGMEAISGGIRKTQIEPDGDLFVGADIDEPEGVSLAVFVNAQEYNTEEMEEGDLLIGDNSSGKANMFYDASEGRLNFRGGTTIQVYIDTDGTIVAGAGNVIIDAMGVTIANSVTSYFRFKDASGDPSNIVIGADPFNDFEFVNLATSPAGTISFFIKDTAGTTRRAVKILEDPASANTVQLDVSPTVGTSAKISIGSEVVIWAQKDGQTTLFNNGLYDIDFEVYGIGDGADDAPTIWSDAGLNRAGFGFDHFFEINEGGTVYLNEQGRDIDVLIRDDAGNTTFHSNAGLHAIGIGGDAESGYSFKVNGKAKYTDGILWGGWANANETWTRVSDHSFTISGDVTTTYRKGAKVRYKEGVGGYEYGVIASSSYSGGTALTTVTLITNTDYAMGGNPHTCYLSYIENPEGFPHWFTWSANPQGFSAQPSSPVYEWAAVGRQITLQYTEANNGTSNATTFTASAPIAPVYAVSAVLSATVDNGALTTTPGRVTLTAGSTTMTLRKDAATGAWTNANGKRAVFFITYEF